MCKVDSLAIVAHSDDAEILAPRGIIESWTSKKSFGVVVVNDGVGRPRAAAYEGYSNEEMTDLRIREQFAAARAGGYSFALALAYDLCDLAYDRRQGLTTLVMQLGARGALRLVDAVLLLATGCVCLNAALGRYPWPVAGALLLSLLISRWCIRYLPPRGDMGDWRKVGIDGLMVLQYGLVCGMG